MKWGPGVPEGVPMGSQGDPLYLIGGTLVIPVWVLGVPLALGDQGPLARTGGCISLGPAGHLFSFCFWFLVLSWVLAS